MKNATTRMISERQRVPRKRHQANRADRRAQREREAAATLILRLIWGTAHLAVQGVEAGMNAREVRAALREHGRGELALHRAIVSTQLRAAPPELQGHVLEEALLERGVTGPTARAVARDEVTCGDPPTFEQRQKVALELERSVQVSVERRADPQTDLADELEIMGWMLRRAGEDWSAWEGELKAGLSEDQGAYLHDRMWWLAELNGLARAR